MAPTPVLLPGKSHGRRSLVGCSPWGRTEPDTAERLHFHFSLSCIGEGNGNPLQCSCLENPRDGIGVPSMGSHRVGHDWSDLAAAVQRERNVKATFNNGWSYSAVRILGLGFSEAATQDELSWEKKAHTEEVEPRGSEYPDHVVWAWPLLLDPAMPEAFTLRLFSSMSQFFTYSARTSSSPLSHNIKLGRQGSNPGSVTYLQARWVSTSVTRTGGRNSRRAVNLPGSCHNPWPIVGAQTGQAGLKRKISCQTDFFLP